MYIIHCLVRNNTRIIPPWRTFVNAVFPQKAPGQGILYNSYFFPDSGTVKLVTFTNPQNPPPFRSEGFFTYPPENNTFSSEISRRSRLFLSLLLYHWQYSANLRLFSPTRQLLQIPNPLLQNSRFPPCRGGCFLKMLCNMTQYRFAMYIYSHIPHNTAFPSA